MATPFNGLGMSLGNLARLSDAKTRSISAENPDGSVAGGAREPAHPEGNSRDLGTGWKCRPCITIDPQTTATLADIDGPGAIQSMWITGTTNRNMILRIYWEGQDAPSVECPLPDFFGTPWTGKDQFQSGPDSYGLLNSLPVCVNPKTGLNCFWEMPFRKHCTITLENRSRDHAACFYQINYTLTDIPDDVAYFHAQFRRTNPMPRAQEYVIVDGIKGKGHYVGTVLGVGTNENGWWGEGEIKFFMDGDDEFPTICGTGTEDYFGGSYDWTINEQYRTYSTPFMGMHQTLRPDGHYLTQFRQGMYRWHVMDPIRFESNLRVQIQALGWGTDGRYLPMMTDMCSVAMWYQTLPATPFPTLPTRDELEII
jgi:hypothetical protein